MTQQRPQRHHLQQWEQPQQRLQRRQEDRWSQRQWAPEQRQWMPPPQQHQQYQRLSRSAHFDDDAFD